GERTDLGRFGEGTPAIGDDAAVGARDRRDAGGGEMSAGQTPDDTCGPLPPGPGTVPSTLTLSAAAIRFPSVVVGGRGDLQRLAVMNGQRAPDVAGVTLTLSGGDFS